MKKQNEIKSRSSRVVSLQKNYRRLTKTNMHVSVLESVYAMEMTVMRKWIVFRKNNNKHSDDEQNDSSRMHKQTTH